MFSSIYFLLKHCSTPRLTNLLTNWTNWIKKVIFTKRFRSTFDCCLRIVQTPFLSSCFFCCCFSVSDGYIKRCCCSQQMSYVKQGEIWCLDQISWIKWRNTTGSADFLDKVTTNSPIQSSRNIMIVTLHFKLQKNNAILKRNCSRQTFPSFCLLNGWNDQHQCPCSSSMCILTVLQL